MEQLHAGSGAESVEALPESAVEFIASHVIRPKFAPTVRASLTFMLVDGWGGQDLNLRPTDYESAALTD